jgi:hypothetical protein
MMHTFNLKTVERSSPKDLAYLHGGSFSHDKITRNVRLPWSFENVLKGIAISSKQGLVQ